MHQPALLELPAKQLLDKFGSGGHKPGSGSAAALMGILSCKLAITVCKLSLSKDKYKSAHKALEYIKDNIEQKIEPKLQEYFQKDAETFDAVIICRRDRDAAATKEDKQKHRKEELHYLRQATEIPIEIGKICLPLIDHGVFIFDAGFQAARGDSGAAVGAAIAAVTASAFIANLNLTSFGSSAWRDSISSQCQEMLQDLNNKQIVAFSRLTKLSKEDIKSLELDYEGEIVTEKKKDKTIDQVKVEMLSALNQMVEHVENPKRYGPKPRKKYA